MRRFAGAAALLAVAVAGVRPVTACINTYQHDDVVRPAQPSPEEIRQNLTTHTPRSEWERKRDAAEARFGYAVDYEAQSDYAAALIHLGEHLRAIPLLEQVEQDHPGLYATATNLGMMVADPGHLVRGAPVGPGDGEMLAKGVQEYRSGKADKGSPAMSIPGAGGAQ